jgi:hypothetical protein
MTQRKSQHAKDQPRGPNDRSVLLRRLRQTKPHLQVPIQHLEDVRADELQVWRWVLLRQLEVLHGQIVLRQTGIKDSSAEGEKTLLFNTRVHGGLALTCETWLPVAGSRLPQNSAGFSSTASDDMTPATPVAARHRSTSSSELMPPLANTGIGTACITHG